jgi:hypothetical protein
MGTPFSGSQTIDFTHAIPACEEFLMAARTSAGTPRNKSKGAKTKVAAKSGYLPLHQKIALYLAEGLALLGAGWVTVVALLGYSASWFTQGDTETHLLPFAGTVLALILSASLILRSWLWLRRRLCQRSFYLPCIVATVIAAVAAAYVGQNAFRMQMASLKTLIGGMREAERTTLAHQVFAAYRRSDLDATRRVLDRALVYWPTVREVAQTLEVDPEVMIGMGAAESSFNPRDSKDGGYGLFQITAPPQVAVDQVRKQLKVPQLDRLNQRHNTWLAAATLRHYLKQMGGDLFLGLLAYNIGPRNGGLLSIMNQYRAKDFITIQPYLKNLPRDYPIRVLTSALAFRLWRQEGKLPHYEDGEWAARIQDVGIPGLKPSQGLLPDHEGG